MPSRVIYLVRHGAYEPDPTDPVDGGTLTDVGRQQASLLADRLAGTEFDVIAHSSALRAVQTADVLAFQLAQVPRHSEDLLRECIPTVPETSDLTDGQREFFTQLPEQMRTDGPLRAEAAVRQFSKVGERDTRELVVSHGNLINFFVSEAMGAPRHGWLRPLDYHCGLTILRYRDDAPPRLITYNDIGHLPQHLRGVEYPQDLRV